MGDQKLLKHCPPSSISKISKPKALTNIRGKKRGHDLNNFERSVSQYQSAIAGCLLRTPLFLMNACPLDLRCPLQYKQKPNLSKLITEKILSSQRVVCGEVHVRSFTKCHILWTYDFCDNGSWFVVKPSEIHDKPGPRKLLVHNYGVFQPEMFFSAIYFSAKNPFNTNIGNIQVISSNY